MIYPLVSDLAAEGIPVARTCRVLGFSKQAFYAWRANPVSDRDWDDAHLINAALDVHADDPTFGYRLIHDELELVQGHAVGRGRMHRLCKQQQLVSVIVKRRGRGKTPGPAVHEDLVRRQFTAECIDDMWFTDITEHPTDDGKLYLCAIKDACSKRIVGYSMGPRMTADLACRALRHAVMLRRPRGTIVHADRGSQFRSGAFTRLLRHHGLQGSMGRVASAGDNAAMESWNALLQKNVLNRKRWNSQEELRLAIITWIERDYHRRRRQAGLGRLTPIEYETIHPASTAR